MAFTIGRFFPFSFVPSLLGNFLTKNYDEYDQISDDINALTAMASQGQGQGQEE